MRKIPRIVKCCCCPNDALYHSFDDGDNYCPVHYTEHLMKNAEKEMFTYEVNGRKVNRRRYLFGECPSCTDEIVIDFEGHEYYSVDEFKEQLLLDADANGDFDLIDNNIEDYL